MTFIKKNKIIFDFYKFLGKKEKYSFYNTKFGDDD